MTRARFSFIAVLGSLATLSFSPVRAQIGGATGAANFQRIQDTPHNLSASGPGTTRATSESEICVFCHTPHGSSGTAALWNRDEAPTAYRIDESASLRANVGQPTGVSKLCLSCHDGTVALGSVRSRPGIIGMAGGADRLTGSRNLGTDLSDDHPVSFPYSSSVNTANSNLLPAAAIPAPVKLDENGEVQCTSCHEVHDNSNGDFLVRPNDAGELCNSCHSHTDWPMSDHATSGVLVAPSVADGLGANATSVAQNACGNCHRSHGAGGPAWILHLDNISEICLKCHDGSVAQGNVLPDLHKFSVHGIAPTGPVGSPNGLYVEGDRVSCADCHNSHATGATAPGVPSSLSGVPGVTLRGLPVDSVTRDHELCFRCHGDSPVPTPPFVDRQATITNKREQFQATNPSFHPVGNPGASSDVPSLIPPLTESSTITCGDCHDSNASRKFGGVGPAGPHGSDFPPLLALRYDSVDFSTESPDAYALCYRCHQRSSILSDESFEEHQLHIVDERTPCSICHDGHGISSAQGNSQNHSHLINFDRSVVLPSESGRLEFEDLGSLRGRCYLSCHGENHDPEEYSRFSLERLQPAPEPNFGPDTDGTFDLK